MLDESLPQPVETTTAQEDSASAAAEPAGGDPVYVYAIAMGVDPGHLPAAGIDAARPVALLAVGGVQALVSEVRAEFFDEESVRAGLQDQRWLATHVFAHQLVIEGLVQAGYPVIPMRFCTLYADRAALLHSLERHAGAFAAELERLAGKQEWGIKQSVDIVTLQKALAQGETVLDGFGLDDAVQKLRKQIAGMSTGAAYLLQKRLTNLIAERAQTIAFAIAEETYQALAEVALDATTADLPKERPEVCLNAAFLVATADFGAFEAVLEQLAGRYGAAGVRYEISGPWAAHHFLQVDFSQVEGVG